MKPAPMKHKHNIFTRALNAAARTLNAAHGVFEELSVPDGAETFRFRLSPYGEFPVTDTGGRDIIQVVDRQAGETMAANFASLGGKLATFFRGVPVYEGHADDEDWLRKNPGHRASAVARIKTIEPGEDGIYVSAALNSAGLDLLGGDAPKYTGHSPHWRLTPIPGRPDHFRPILLWSTALTNTPNILQNAVALNALQGVCEDHADPSPAAGSAGADTENQQATDNDMKLTPDALKALGFAPEAEPTPDEISAAIIKLAGDQAEAAARIAAAEGETTAANSRASQARTESEALRAAAVETVLDAAVRDGRITEADRPSWTTALNTSFVSERDKLSKLMPVLNTTNRMAAAGRRDLAPTDAINSAARITDAVTAFAVEKSMDITTAAGWTRAFEACRAARPEVFGK